MNSLTLRSLEKSLAAFIVSIRSSPCAGSPEVDSGSYCCSCSLISPRPSSATGRSGAEVHVPQVRPRPFRAHGGDDHVLLAPALAALVLFLATADLDADADDAARL